MKLINLRVKWIVALKSTQKGLPAPDSDACYARGSSPFLLGYCFPKWFYRSPVDYFGVNDVIMTYFIQIILKIKIFCIKIAWFFHFTKIITSKASKSLVFVFFFTKKNDLNTKPKILPLLHQSQSNSLHTNSDLTRRSTTLTLNSTKTCEKARKRKISVLETHYFLL